MTIHVSTQNGLAKVLLDHPPLNLLSDRVKEELTEVFKRIGIDPSVRVILFYTAGEHFCCGANLKEFPKRIQNKTAREVWLRGHEMLATIMNLPQPTVAYIKGKALGGGAELASAFDIRIFSPSAQIGYPEVFRGVFPGNGGLERLITLVGECFAMKLALTGKSIDSDYALRCGLASEVVSNVDDGLQYTEELANDLANLPGVALKVIKQAIKSIASNPKSFMDEGKELFYQVHESQDVKEAIAAFLEKRNPLFLHC
jgi:enoyl-CoA hydratase/carnithine racemase